MKNIFGRSQKLDLAFNWTKVSRAGLPELLPKTLNVGVLLEDFFAMTTGELVRAIESIG